MSEILVHQSCNTSSRVSPLMHSRPASVILVPPRFNSRRRVSDSRFFRPASETRDASRSNSSSRLNFPMCSNQNVRDWDRPRPAGYYWCREDVADVNHIGEEVIPEEPACPGRPRR